MRAPILLLTFCGWAFGQIENARIALRLDSAHVLIVGRYLDTYDPAVQKLPKSMGSSPLQPMEDIFLVKADPKTAWRVGDRWRIYPGAGPSIPVVIESLSVGYYCGGIGGYAGAVGRIEGANSANVVSGLRAGEYLAMQGAAMPGVSEQPLVPLGRFEETDLQNSVERLLLERARKTVTSEDWGAEHSGQARQMNRRFLAGTELRGELRFQRWRVPGEKPLLLVEALWRDTAGIVFAANAVIQEGGVPVILDFDPTPGQRMRFAEFMADGWERSDPGPFLNAWVVGKRRLFLLYTHGYEGFGVDLKELVPGKGLVPTKTEFGAGC